GESALCHCQRTAEYPTEKSSVCQDASFDSPPRRPWAVAQPLRYYRSGCDWSSLLGLGGMRLPVTPEWLFSSFGTRGQAFAVHGLLLQNCRRAVCFPLSTSAGRGPQQEP